MKLAYEDLLSGDPILMDGVGHIRSPYLRELKPTSGIGMWMYNLYLNALSWDKEDFLKAIGATSKINTNILSKNPKLEAYDLITLVPNSRKLLLEAMAFFVCEPVAWEDEEKKFLVLDPTTKEPMGEINRENFEEVRKMILQMNYVSAGDTEKPVRHSSSKAQALWETAQKFLKQERKNTKSDSRMNLGNIISKVCAAGVGYTLLNIYDLTVFQLYDQFFQIGYLRAMKINEAAFSFHGGKKFDVQAWLNPINR